MTAAPEAHSSKPFTLLLLASLGGALEFYDFVVFVFFTSAIQTLFFSAALSEWVRLSQTFGIFAAGYLARPVGGIVMAHFGDTRGRKRVFTLSILMMAVPTLAIGLLPTYASIGVAAPLLLLLMRLMQGAAIGGEAPGGWVYVAEHAPRRSTGLAIGMLTGGLCLGIFLGSLMSFGIGTYFSKAEILAGVWRVPFLLGGVFGLAGMWLRNRLSETPVFLAMRQRARASKALPLLALLKAHRGSIALSVAATWMLTAAIVVVILMTPALLSHLSALPLRALQAANLAASAALCVSLVVIGAATDRFGVRTVLVPSGLLLIASTYLLYARAASMPAHLVALYTFAGLGAGAAVFAPICMVHAFPPALRFSGVSFSYNMAYAVLGGVTPPLVLSLTHFGRIGPAHYVAVATAAGIAAVWIAVPATASVPATSSL